jgi:toxin YoeB
LIYFTIEAWEEFTNGYKDDKKTQNKIIRLINETLRQPFTGIGKPEPLKGNLSGYWSRRIDAENRLVYKISPEGSCVVKCKYD